MTKQSLLLFSKVSVDAGMAHPQELIDGINASGEDVVAHHALLENMVFYIAGEETDVIDAPTGTSLRTYDNVYFRYWGKARSPAMTGARFCDAKGIPYLDREVLRRGAYDKMTQYMQLWAANVAVPKSLIGLPPHLVSYFEHYGFTFPCIMKATEGTRGKHNYLIRDMKQLQALADDVSTIPFVLQEFIPNDGDYRVWVVGGEVVAIIGRKATEGSHLNNTSQGGDAEWLELDALPEFVKDMCIRGAAFLDRDIAGVDIVQSKTDGAYYCFEVNRSPQVEFTPYADKKAAFVARLLATL